MSKLLLFISILLDSIFSEKQKQKTILAVSYEVQYFFNGIHSQFNH